MKEFLINLPFNEKTMSQTTQFLASKHEHFTVFRKFS